MHGWKQRVWSWAGLAALMTGCVAHGPPPRELIDARQAYQHASTSPAVQQERPQDLQEAWQALIEAEREYDRNPSSPAARSLAYVALRKAQLAEAHASIAVAERQRALAAQALAQAQEAERRRAEAELRAAQQQLAEARGLRDEAARLAEARRLEAEAAQLRAEAQRREEQTQRLTLEEQRRREAQAQAQQLAQTQAQVETERRAREEAERRANEQLEAEREARAEAERRATEALTRLERSGEVGVREDARGMVLTLSGSVLFASGQAELLPSARNRLSEVAEALKQSPNALTIEGHTDSQGPDFYNEDLSLQRAEQVRDYLLSRGVPPDRIAVRGLGEYRPVASNSTPEGRANNRRVEIVLQRVPEGEGGRTGVGGSGQKDTPR
ncbi:OmpA family protein [Hyalangium sp.]|uniref:OmpA family protein n=1 Tax=Hyalangium sp. TaxID=2028555 RepID=UPI002D25ED9A|nr:OmpA family protein [Hyalangium sp.]HYI01520.1 OmpA family protein [Hyalangium sp.]